MHLRRVWTEDAGQRLREALDAAWGQLPADLTVRLMAGRGDPGRLLTIIASGPGDLLVAGTGRRTTLTGAFCGR